MQCNKVWVFLLDAKLTWNVNTYLISFTSTIFDNLTSKQEDPLLIKSKFDIILIFPKSLFVFISALKITQTVWTNF